MHFDLTTPCDDCPFRTGGRAIRLSKARVREIIHAITDEQRTFACHKTTRHDDDGEHAPHNGEQHCAGALIYLEKNGQPNQMMRWMERIGFYDKTKLDMTAPVFDGASDMLKANA